jgi:guanylate kinase
MGKIFCLLGKSCSGKDTFYRMLCEAEDLNLNRIILHTTRPIRPGEQDGKEYHFEDSFPAHRCVVEMRSYYVNSTKATWCYWTEDNGSIDLKYSNYIVISTLESFISYRKHFGVDKVVGIYIESDENDRFERIAKREREATSPNYSEACRRYLSDEQDFSPTLLLSANINYNVKNTILHKTYDEIKHIIKEEI